MAEVLDRSDQIVECVPNFSEGRDEQVVREIVSAMQVPEVRLLDWSMDAAHNRSVVTVAGPCEAVAESAVRGVGRACQLIDLTRQSGEHPRIGAADVVPFVPVRGISMGDVVKLAHRAGMEMWRRYGMPVYFYEAAAVRPDRVKLEEVRRGQFEGLCAAVRTDSRRWPDVGAGALHPTAGAAAVGARQFLIAYNIYLDSTDVSVARAIAKQLRAAGGGMPGVKAMGVMVDGRAQVSMNLTDLRLTPVAAVHREVGLLAQRHGVRIAEGELIGLIPEAACEPNAAWVRQIPQFRWEQKVLEARLASPLAWPGLVRPVLAA
ncbi:glutamate formimidoyltransferase [Terriglobus aquaticus]|uniref:glutamate formimidoyltransferase n=1 Tax=Terriglobus aquaticus TaxID=940139 RepID=A0ABW9KKE2_9BACT